ncbi:MAG: zinc-dependent peptidase [Xanthomonadales bacterium]|nr:zinc-dependent peptidase [Xanthomonadales bacterium]
MLQWLRRRIAGPDPIADADWRATREAIALLDGLDAGSLERLRQLTSRFLHDKDIVGAGDLELSAHDRRVIATLACLPVLSLGYGWLGGWRQVIVYGDAFRVRREWHDENSGVVTEGDDWLAGEAWQQGPLVLSLADIQADLDDPHAGFNLVAHEIAHKLDMLDGHSDGVPPLPDRARHRQWLTVFQREFDSMRTRVEAGQDTFLDPYAGEAPDEFFAVASEAYFSCPRALAAAHPALHRELRAFYGVEPDLPA